MTVGDTGKGVGDARCGAATRAMCGRALSRYTRTPNRHRRGTAWPRVGNVHLRACSAETNGIDPPVVLHVGFLRRSMGLHVTVPEPARARESTVDTPCQKSGLTLSEGSDAARMFTESQRARADAVTALSDPVVAHRWVENTQCPERKPHVGRTWSTAMPAWRPPRRSSPRSQILRGPVMRWESFAPRMVVTPPKWVICARSGETSMSLKRTIFPIAELVFASEIWKRWHPLLPARPQKFYIEFCCVRHLTANESPEAGISHPIPNLLSARLTRYVVDHMKRHSPALCFSHPIASISLP